MIDEMNLLGGLSVEQFLAEYWHKKPLLIRQAFPGYQMPITADELAGLACEDGVESRLILEKDGDTPWQLEYGPFDEARFSTLPDTHWTLLVQEINKYIPEFALLQERFAFIPCWRLDDVMVSYAPDKGTVGPHADNYDVFLLQGHGKRHWQINRQAPTSDELIPGLPLRIMATFEAQDDWVLEPGDMLYLPPSVAHYGVAEGDCMTVSVGFRAPNHADMLAHFANDFSQTLGSECFYADPDLATQASTGLISPQALQKIQAMIRALPLDDASINRWFGRYITEPKPGHDILVAEIELSSVALLEMLLEHGELWRSEYCRFAYQQDAEGGVRLYVAGIEYQMARELAFAAALLCDQRVLSVEALQEALSQPDFVELLCRLYNAGALYFPEYDEP